jgi:plastocyanin
VEYEDGVKWGFVNNADFTFLVRDLRINNVEQLLLYQGKSISSSRPAWGIRPSRKISPPPDGVSRALTLGYIQVSARTGAHGTRGAAAESQRRGEEGKMRREPLIVVAILVLGVALLAPGVWTSHTSVQAAGATITIPGDSYIPAAVVIDTGQTVTWVNKDSDKHTAVSVLGAPETFTLPAYPGKSASFKFTKPGVYPYYCQEHVTYDAKLRRAVARKESDAYPIAMEGIIVVKGPGFTGAPAATINISRGAFAPDIAVVQPGGKVTWTNGSTDAQAIVVNGADVPKLDLAAGKSQTATFAKPGIYLFYDERHATYNNKLGLAAAKTGAPNFPVAMKGYVIVL